MLLYCIIRSALCVVNFSIFSCLRRSLLEPLASSMALPPQPHCSSYICKCVFKLCNNIYIYTHTYTHIAGGVKLRVIDCTLRHQLRGMAEDNVAGLPRPRLPHAAAPCAAASDAPPQPPLTRPRPPPPPLSEEEIVRIAPRPLTCTLALPFLVYAPHVAPSRGALSGGAVPRRPRQVRRRVKLQPIFSCEIAADILL